MEKCSRRFAQVGVTVGIGTLAVAASYGYGMPALALFSLVWIAFDVIRGVKAFVNESIPQPDPTG